MTLSKRVMLTIFNLYYYYYGILQFGVPNIMQEELPNIVIAHHDMQVEGGVR